MKERRAVFFFRAKKGRFGTFAKHTPAKVCPSKKHPASFLKQTRLRESTVPRSGLVAPKLPILSSGWIGVAMGSHRGS